MFCFASHCSTASMRCSWPVCQKFLPVWDEASRATGCEDHALLVEGNMRTLVLWDIRVQGTRCLVVCSRLYHWLLDIRQIIRQISCMEATITELLREFPRVRRAVFAGETVIIKSREGSMRLTLETPSPVSLIGCMKGLLRATENDIDRPTSDNRSWESHL